MLRNLTTPASNPVKNKTAAPAVTGSGGNLKIGKLSANQEYPKSGSPATVPSRTSVKSQVKRKPLILPSKANGTCKAPNTSLKPKISLRLPNRPTSAAPAKSNNHLVAERFAAHRISVFPCETKDQPLVKWKAESTTDLTIIDELWCQYPNALPAIDLAKSGLIVIDADRHGGPDGVAAIKKLMGGNVYQFNAPVVRTPNDGLHLYFRQPIDHKYRNGSGTLPDAIDVRGEGGYVIAPGTKLPDGRSYVADPKAPSLSAALRANSVPVLPKLFVDRLRKPARNTAAVQTTTAANRKPTPCEKRYASVTLQNLAKELAATKAGMRNDKLNNSAFRMGTMLGRGWISRGEIESSLTKACRANGLIQQDGINSVQATIKSGIEAGIKQPHANLPPLRLPSKRSSLDIVCAANVPLERIAWMWRGRLARGKHVTIAGEPGTGKSQLTLRIAASVTTGGEWPCGEGRAPLGNVVILSAEDGAADTIIPRLAAAGADLSRVRIVRATLREDGKGRRPFSLQADLELLEAKIKEIGNVALIIIDPISSYMGGRVDSHKNTETRSVLEPIGQLAERTNAAVLSVNHLTKSGARNDIKALHRVIGSIAFTAAPRAVFAVAEDPNDNTRRLFLSVKNNLARPPQGLAFTIEQTMVGENNSIQASRIRWAWAPVTASADEVLRRRNNREPSAKVAAIEFLRSALATGPVRVPELEQQAREAGLLADDQRIGQSKPFRDAKQELGITSRQPRGQRTARDG